MGLRFDFWQRGSWRSFAFPVFHHVSYLMMPVSWWIAGFIQVLLVSYCFFLVYGALDKFNIISNFSNKVDIFIPLEVLAWVMTACWVFLSKLIYFWRNTDISFIFHFSKSISINTQRISQWGTQKMMLFPKYLIKKGEKKKRKLESLVEISVLV